MEVSNLIEQAKQFARQQMGQLTNDQLFSAEAFHQKFAELLIQECIIVCEEAAEKYFRLRKNTYDFEEKNIFAEGEAACGEIKYEIKKRLGVK